MTHRLAVIGCGDIAVSRHLPALLANPAVQVVAVCDADSARAEQAAARFGVAEATADADRIFGDPNVDAVVIATPPWVTPQLTMAALQAGKDVLCEKPMATSVAVAEEVARVEAESGRLVQVGFTYRHGLLIETLRGWIAAGRLGAPLFYRLGIYDEVWDPDGQPEHYARILATLRHGPPCVHDGAHSADHLHFLTGSQVTEVTAWGLTTRPEFPAPNLNVALLGFANGDRARLEIGWFYPHFPRGEFEIVGPEGVAVFDREARTATLTTGKLTEQVRQDEDYFESCFRIQLDKFLRARETRTTPVPGTAEGIASLRLCKAIERAVLEHGNEGTPA